MTDPVTLTLNELISYSPSVTIFTKERKLDLTQNKDCSIWARLIILALDDYASGEEKSIYTLSWLLEKYLGEYGPEVLAYAIYKGNLGVVQNLVKSVPIEKAQLDVLTMNYIIVNNYLKPKSDEIKDLSIYSGNVEMVKYISTFGAFGEDQLKLAMELKMVDIVKELCGGKIPPEMKSKLGLPSSDTQ